MTNRYQKYKKSYEKYRKTHKKETVELRDIYWYGGNRTLALERDNRMCINCGMTQEQHIILFGRGLTVDHKDGKGRYSKIKNNNLENLQTLCLRCHGFKDVKRRKTRPVKQVGI